MLVNPGAISTAVETRDLEKAVRELNLEGAARGLNFQLLIVTARTDGDLEQAFDQSVRWGAGALLVSADSFFTDSHVRIVELAAGHALPASYPWPQYVDAGGLISYGTTLSWAYGQIGAYAARILKGDKPADLPVHMPSTFELAINLTTARSLGLTIPPNLLALAQKIVE
jgi:putative ABC transport system substrate-binding protein